MGARVPLLPGRWRCPSSSSGSSSVSSSRAGPRPATRSCSGCRSIPTPSWYAGVQIGGPVSLQAVLSAALDGARLACLLCCIGAANTLANPKRALRVLPGALYELGVAVTVALSVAPQLVDSAQRVRRGRRLRGSDRRGLRALRAIAVPVLHDALERSLLLAAAMDSRGYGRTGRATRASRRVTGRPAAGRAVGAVPGRVRPARQRAAGRAGDRRVRGRRGRLRRRAVPGRTPGLAQPLPPGPLGLAGVRGRRLRPGQRGRARPDRGLQPGGGEPVTVPAAVAVAAARADARDPGGGAGRVVAPPPPAQPPTAAPVRAAPARRRPPEGRVIVFDRVGVTYDGSDRPVLRNVSLRDRGGRALPGHRAHRQRQVDAARPPSTAWCRTSPAAP